MKDHLSVFEMQRIRYINKLMDRIHDQTNALYENLMDEEYVSVKEDLKELRRIYLKLQQLKIWINIMQLKNSALKEIGTS